MTRGDYSDDFHTFGMEWSDSYIYTWVDSRLAVCFSSIILIKLDASTNYKMQQSLYVPFGKRYGTMYDRGNFADMSVNGSIPVSSILSASLFTILELNFIFVA